MQAFKDPEWEFHKRNKEAKINFDSNSEYEFIMGDVVVKKILILEKYAHRTWEGTKPSLVWPTIKTITTSELKE